MTIESYRPPYSPFAVISAVASALMPLAYFNVGWVLLALVAIPAGLVAIRAHRRYEHGGVQMAVKSVAVALFVAFVAPSWHLYLFNSEAPRGYDRLDFAGLASRGNEAFEPFIGRKVCLKGFQLCLGKSPSDGPIRLSYDGNYQRREFALPVKYVGTLTDEWHFRVAISGVLELNPDYDGEKDKSRYRIVEAEIRPIRSGWQFPVRMRGDC